MVKIIRSILLLSLASLSQTEPSLHYNNLKEDIFERNVNFMAPKKSPHIKSNIGETGTQKQEGVDSWAPYDFSKFDAYIAGVNDAADPNSPDHNRIKRRAKRRRGRGGRRRTKLRTTTPQIEETEASSTATKAPNTTSVPIARRGDWDRQQSIRRRKKSKDRQDTKDKTGYEVYEPPVKDFESTFVEMPKDLYQAHLRPGVIFRIHMSEAILKMQYRNYGEDKDESVIEADVEYLRLTRKVINDEITKFEDLRWLMEWFINRTELIQEHVCNTRYYAVGIPPTMFTHTEEYMKRLCLFDNVYIDHIPYVIGEDSSLIAAVAPPVLHCDAATCTSVPFIDSMMFDEKFARTSVRSTTRCQASCRAHCRNDPDCLKRCNERCLRAD